MLGVKGLSVFALAGMFGFAASVSIFCFGPFSLARYAAVRPAKVRRFGYPLRIVHPDFGVVGSASNFGQFAWVLGRVRLSRLRPQVLLGVRRDLRQALHWRRCFGCVAPF